MSLRTHLLILQYGVMSGIKLYAVLMANRELVMYNFYFFLDPLFHIG